MPFKPLSNVKKNYPSTTNDPLHIPQPHVESIVHILKAHFHHTTHNPHARATYNYSVIKDLVQSPMAMSTLEVLQNYLFEQKSLLSSLNKLICLMLD